MFAVRYGSVGFAPNDPRSSKLHRLPNLPSCACRRVCTPYWYLLHCLVLGGAECIHWCRRDALCHEWPLLATATCAWWVGAVRVWAMCTGCASARAHDLNLPCAGWGTLLEVLASRRGIVSHGPLCGWPWCALRCLTTRGHPAASWVAWYRPASLTHLGPFWPWAPRLMSLCVPLRTTIWATTSLQRTTNPLHVQAAQRPYK